MQIANPIYDVVFKYLLDDNKIAKKILSLIIDQEIIELSLLPTEFRNDFEERGISIYRLDFSATVKLSSGENKNIIIEIQKAKYPTDIMRFRKYLGGRYADPGNSFIDENGVEHARPILSIYFLGHNLDNIDTPIINVSRQYYDRLTNKVIDEKDEFIESLTHDSFIIQIKKLNKSSQNKLEQVLSVFESSKSIKHFLEVDEAHYPQEYRDVIRRLLKAASKSDIRKTMDVEDEIIATLEQMEREIANTIEEKNEAMVTAKNAIEARVKAEAEAKKAEAEAKKAEEETKKAKDKTLQLESKTQQLESKTQQLESKAQQFESKAQQLESKAQQAENEKREAEEKLQNALAELVASGMTDEQARQLLNI